MGNKPRNFILFTIYSSLISFWCVDPSACHVNCSVYLLCAAYITVILFRYVTHIAFWCAVCTGFQENRSKYLPLGRAYKSHFFCFYITFRHLIRYSFQHILSSASLLNYVSIFFFIQLFKSQSFSDDCRALQIWNLQNFFLPINSSSMTFICI